MERETLKLYPFICNFISARQHRFKSAWDMTTRLLSDNMIFLIKSGSIKTLDGNGNSIILKSKELILFRKGSIVNAQQIGDNLELSVIHFTAQKEDQNDLFENVESIHTFDISKNPYYENVINKLREEEISRKMLWENNCNYLCGSLVFEILRKYENQLFISNKLQQINPKIVKCLNFIEENINRTIKIWEVAASTNLSESHLRVLFKKEMGISPVAYIQNLKIAKSIELKNEKKISWQRVSEILGYQNVYYFYQTFKKVTNRTPKAYLENEL